MSRSSHPDCRATPTTQDSYRRILGKYYLPAFQKTKLGNITLDDITAITDRLPTFEQAHALAVGRCFFRWCVRPPRRYLAHNPLEGIQLTMGKRRKRTLKDPEIVILWRAATAQGYPHGTAIKFLLLLGQRKTEIGSLDHSWVDTQEHTITLPEWLTKNSTEHCLPYGNLVASILQDIPRRNSTLLLFPSRWADDRPLSGWSKFKKELNDGLAHWTLHDLRRTFATGLARLGVQPHIIEKLLNHKLGSISNKMGGIVSDVAEVYNLHQYLPEMRHAMQLWEAHITKLLAADTFACAA